MVSAQDEARSLPGYEIVELLGYGGFGVVYRARQLAVQREVALKIDNRVLATDRDRRRFMREVTAAGRLSGHPHVVAVYDAGVFDDGRPYMVLELCPGGSLGDRLRDKGPFPAAEVRDIGMRIADALAAAHAAGVLHRDIKPANILVNEYGGVALADFGLAAMPTPGFEVSATREALTPAYAPPEAFRREEPTPAGDVYALGATLYALLQGRPPRFPEGGSPSIVALMALHHQPVPDLPGVPPALTAVLRQAMAYDPTARQPGAVALRDALAAVDPAAVSALPPTPSAPLSHDRPPSTDPAPSGQAATKAGRGSGGVTRGLVLGAAAMVAAGLVGGGALIAIAGGGEPQKTAASAPSGAPTSGPASGGAEKAVFGVPTVTANCPAASVPGAQARCVATAECWGGIVSINGNVTVNRSDCAIEHHYETFAIAPLPPDGQTHNVHDLEKHPTVRQVCSRAVMAQSRRGGALKYSPSMWSVEVVPPSQTRFEIQGVRVYRCVAGLTGRPGTGAVFLPRS